MKKNLKCFLITFLSVFVVFNLNAKNLYGFKLVEEKDYTSQIKAMFFEHEKSGATVVYLKSDDINRGFDAVVKTAAYDNIGLPHIFEHSCLAGSQKYPASNLFFQMTSQTYNSYMNAHTFQYITSFPMSSLSEKQLMASIDVYMNGIFYPMVLTEENDLKREAVRIYENEDGVISATGAVYNELQGAYSDINRLTSHSIKTTLFPDSIASYDTGGIPEDILKVTIDDVRSFHKKYYTPSNMIFFLYGKLDYKKYLKYFDEEFFSKMEKNEVSIKDSDYSPWKGFRDVEIAFPASRDYKTENTSVFNYVFTLPDLDRNDFNSLRVINYLFNKDSSSVNQIIKKNYPAATFSGYFDMSCIYPYFVFSVKNINPADKENIKKLILDCIYDFQNEEIDSDIIEIFGNDIKMSTILDDENPSPVSLMDNAGYLWGITGNKDEFISNYNNLMNFTSNTTADQVMKIYKKYFLKPETSAVIFVKPVAGLLEENNQKLQLTLNEYKNSMNEEEVKKFYSDNKDYEKWLSENEKINLIDQVKVIDSKNLPEESFDPEIKDIQTKDYHLIYGINKNSLYFSASEYFDYSGIPEQYLNPFMLYLNLLGELPTKSYDLAALDKICNQTFYNSSSHSLYFKNKDSGVSVYGYFGFMALKEKINDCFSLMEELLFNTKLEDIDTIRSIAAREFKNKKQSLVNNPYNLGLSIAEVAALPQTTPVFYAFRFNFWDFLEKVSKMSDEEVKQLCEQIEAAKKYILNTNRLTFTCIGSQDSVENCINCENTFSSLVCHDKYENQKTFTDAKPYPDSIAVIIPGNVNYNFEVLPLKITENGQTLEKFKYEAKYCVLSSYLSDSYIFSTLRYKYGAYGASCNLTEDMLIFATYRDSCIKESFNTFEESHNFLMENQPDLLTLDGYLTQIYSELAEPASMYSLISSKISRYLRHNYEKNYILNLMKNVKSVKIEDLKDFQVLLKDFSSGAIKVTVGNAEKINENKALYKLIINDFMN